MPDFEVLSRGIEITAANNTLHVDEDSGDFFTITLDPDTYYLTGNGVTAGATPDLAAELEAKLNAGSPGAYTYTVTYEGLTDPAGPTGRVIVTISATTFSLLWLDGATTLDAQLFGFLTNTPAGASAQSLFSPSATWVPNQPIRILDPAGSKRAVTQHPTPNGSRFTFVAGDPWRFRTLGFEHIAGARTWDQYAPADLNRAFECFWENGVSLGQILLLSRTDEVSPGVLNTLLPADIVDTYKAVDAGLTDFDPVRPDDTIALFDWRLPMAVEV